MIAPDGILALRAMDTRHGNQKKSNAQQRKPTVQSKRHDLRGSHQCPICLDIIIDAKGGQKAKTPSSVKVSAMAGYTDVVLGYHQLSSLLFRLILILFTVLTVA